MSGVFGSGRVDPDTTSTIVPSCARLAKGAVPLCLATSRLRVTVVLTATFPMLPGQRALQAAVVGVGVGTGTDTPATPVSVALFGLNTREM